MFGLKFKSWMENHIVRPRKKRSKDGKSGKNAPDCAVTVDYGGSTAVNPVAGNTDQYLQSLQKSAPAIAVTRDAITLSPPNHPSFHPSAGNNLSSPESAYSTGYSTDGTSPGAGPEYYINIRTGTHYFLPHSANNLQVMPPNPSAHASHSNFVGSTLTASGLRVNPLVAPSLVPPGLASPNLGQRITVQESQHLIYKAPQKMAQVPDGGGHRRTESCDESRRLKETFPLESYTSPLLTASPRQRTRIRTNPWLSTNPSPILGGFKTRTSIIESTTSSSSGFKKGGSTSSYGSSCGKLSPCARGGDSICSLTSSPSSPSHSTDDDLTLNEMLGKFDESYVYEKETDILSDSDPTDCDESDLEAGQEGGDERDTQDEEELDFIDDSPLDLPDVDNGNKGHCTYHDFARKPRYRESVHRRSGTKKDEGSPRMKRLERYPSRKSSRDVKHVNKHENNPNSSQSSSKCTSEKKRLRQSVHKSARERNLQNQNRLQNSPVFKDKFFKGVDNENIGTGKVFSKILVQKMLSRENVIGTRSAGNTPISSRKKVGGTVVKSDRNAALIVNEEQDLERRRSNSVSNVLSKRAASREDPLTSHASELALIQADKEADRKYRQLILEAEQILTTMKDQIPMQKHTIPKPNILSRKFDLDRELTPKIERKEQPKKCVDNHYHLKNASKRSQRTRSPILHIKTLVVNDEVPRAERRILRDRKDEDERMSDLSDGSLTPKQEDFDDPPSSPVHSYKWRKNTYEELQDNPIKSSMIRTVKSSHQARWHQEADRKNSNVITPRLNHFSASDHLHRERETKKVTNKHLSSPVLVDRQSHKPKCTEINVNLVASNSSGREDMFLYSRNLVKKSPELSKKIPPKMVKSPTLNGVSRPPLVAFRSIDLGTKLEDSTYCPQSEPVKRKVYTCSATFGRLRKSIGEKGQVGSSVQDAEQGEDDSRNSLREKLERLRRERNEREHNQMIDSSNIDAQQNQRQLSLIRRQMLVNTIEGLKRSLEDQSAKLKATYSNGDPSTLLTKRD